MRIPNQSAGVIRTATYRRVAQAGHSNYADAQIVPSLRRLIGVLGGQECFDICYDLCMTDILRDTEKCHRICERTCQISMPPQPAVKRMLVRGGGGGWRCYYYECGICDDWSPMHCLDYSKPNAPYCPDWSCGLPDLPDPWGTVKGG